MIPGTISKLSEQIISLSNTVVQKTDVIRVSSTATTTVIVTLTPPFPQNNGICYLLNTSGAAITATTAGNFATTCSIPNLTTATFTYSKSTTKWYVDKTT
jgi:hypothetical protein